MAAPTQETIIGKFGNARLQQNDFLQLVDNTSGRVFAWIDYLGKLQGSFATTEAGGNPGDVQFNSSGGLGGTDLFNWATTIGGLFIGPQNNTFGANLATYFNSFNPNLQVNKHILSTDSGTLGLGSGVLFQVDKDIVGYGFYSAADYTNNIASAVIGIESDIFYNVPAGHTNNNIQTCFENSMVAYGAGNSAGMAAHYASANNNGTGTVTEGTDFLAAGITNTGGGSITNVFGFHSFDMAGVGSALTAAFKADAQTGNGFAFYSVNAPSYFGGTASTLAVRIVNPTAATSLGSQSNSPIQKFEGQYWTGAASALDSWTIQNVLSQSQGAAVSTLTFSHVGTANNSVTFNTNLNATFTIQGGTILGTTQGLFDFNVGGSGAVNNITSVANASGGTTTYTGTFNPAPVAGEYTTIAGFTNGANNGRFMVSSCNSTTLVLFNASGVSETHAATSTTDNPYYNNGGGYTVGFGPTSNTYSILGTNHIPDAVYEGFPNNPFVFTVKGDATDSAYIRNLSSTSGGVITHGLEIGSIIDGSGAAPITMQMVQIGATSRAIFNAPVTVAGTTPTGSSGQISFGNTQGFGTGASGTAVTTTTKGGGTGPTTPQTIVNYLQIDVAGAKYYIPLVQ